MILLAYVDYLKQLLEPTGIYDLDSGIGACELAVIGAQLDEIFSELELLGREAILASAEDLGLRKYEELLPYRPAYITMQDARRAVMALLRIREGCFTLDALNDTLGGCGIDAAISEGETAQTAVVKFPSNRGIPEGFEGLKKRIEQIIPCHIAAQYIFLYTLWSEIMAKLPSWGALESKVKSWKELEIYQ